MGLVGSERAVRGRGGGSIAVRVSGRVLAFDEVSVVRVASNATNPETQDHGRRACGSGGFCVGACGSVHLEAVCRGSPDCRCALARDAHLCLDRLINGLIDRFSIQ